MSKHDFAKLKNIEKGKDGSESSKVLHICKVYLPVKGGVQRVVQRITARLADFTHQVITTGEDGAVDRQQLDRADVIRCRSYGQLASMPIAPSLPGQVIKIARKQDLIALHYPFPLAELALCFFFSNTPIVVHWHSNIIAQKKLKWLVAPLTLVVLWRAKAIVATSGRMIENSFWLKRFRNKVRTIPYGMESVTPSQTLPLAPNGYFVVIGRHVSYKGIDVAIRSLEHSDHRLIIVGDGPLFERHKLLAEDLGLKARVKFEQQANDEKVNEILQSAIALVVSSNRENEAFALVQLEAMRLGKAVINTNLNSSVPWVARHEKEALTVPPDDAKALAQAMQTLKADPELASSLGEQGLLRYQEKFTAEHFAQATSELYRAHAKSLAQ
ncbi:MAG: glycosyltransferase [Pseudomonadota bacterium]